MAAVGPPFAATIIAVLLCAGILTASNEPGAALSGSGKPAVDQLIPWLLDEQSQLRGLPFSEVIADATGKRVLPFDPKDEIDQRVLKQIRFALDETLKRLNAPDNPVQNIRRINEVSSHFENSLRELLDAAPGLKCDFPRTTDGRVQRSGYPDLRIVDRASNKVFYLDPKLYAAGSRNSSFRTFYFEPKIATGKIHDDAIHFIAGIEHQAGAVAASLSRDEENDADRTATEGRGYKTMWKFTRWDVVDLSNFKVRLKAEFQGSNRDLYRSEAVVASSAK